tara:strand:- start:117 stop:437 length:321 start_codon:yes stop_codon:yes gene_type:complete
LITLDNAEEPFEARILVMLDRITPSEAIDKAGGEGWLVNGQQQLVVQFKPDASLSHGQWVELRTYSWVRPQPPVPQSRRTLSRHIAIETWKHMVQVGWRRCSPPVR